MGIFFLSRFSLKEVTESLLRNAVLLIMNKITTQLGCGQSYNGELSRF